MSVLAAAGSGNLSTASTWHVADTTSYQTIASQITNQTINGSNTTPVQSSAFAPGAITIDGIGLWVRTVTSGAGAITIRLFNVATSAVVSGASVTININDIPGSSANDIGWIFVKFGSPVTLLVSTNYAVQVLGAGSGGQVNFTTTSTAGNFCRYLRTTTTQSPAASDTLIITGERTGAGVNNALTVSIDTTGTTAYASLDVGLSCVFTVLTAASTAYYFKVNGTIWFHQGAFLTLGTSGTPMPSSSSLIIDVSTGSSNAIWIDDECTVVTFGAGKTGTAFLTADCAIAATTFVVNDATGWQIGDTVVLSSATITVTDYETKVITGISGTTITVSGLAKAHSGTSPYICEVLNLTRNVQFLGNTSSCGFRTHNACYVDFTNTEWNIFGGTLNSADGRHGLELWNANTGLYHANLTGCSAHDFFGNSGALQIGQSSTDGNNTRNVDIQDMVLFNLKTGITSGRTDTSGLTLNNVSLILTGSGANGFSFQRLDMIMTNIIISSANGIGFFLQQNQSSIVSGTLGNFTVHSCSGNGLQIATNILTLSDVTCWRTTGISLTSAYVGSTANFITLDSWNLYANGTGQIQLSNTVRYPVVFKNCIINGGTGSGASANGILLNTQIFGNAAFEGCTFSNHSTADINLNTVNNSYLTFSGCTFSSSIRVRNPSNLFASGYLSFMRDGGVAGVHSSYSNAGQFMNDSAIKRSGSSSFRMTPFGSGLFLTSLFNIKIAALAGDSPTFSVYVRKSIIADGGAAYAGNAPRLVILQNPTADYANETILATSVAANGNWELLTATLPPVPEDTILTLALDSGASAGFCNWDDFSVNLASRDTSNLNFYDSGQAATILGNSAQPILLMNRRRKVV